MFRRIERAVQDLGYGWRMLRRSPVFTLVAVLSLGLGIGVNTAIFGVIYAVLLEGLPLPGADQLVVLRRTSAQNLFASEEFRALRKANTQTTLSAFASAGMVRLALGEQRDFVSIEQVDGSFFNVLGLRPLRGRLITPSDDATGAAVVVISETMWERYFQRRDDALGKTITLNDAPFAVVGVTSSRYQGLYFPGTFQMAVPLSSAASLSTRRTNLSGPAVTVIGRLGDSATIQQSEAALDAAYQGCCAAGQLSGTAEPVSAGSHVVLAEISHGIPGKIDVRAENALLLKILMAGVAIVLLIVCANVGNLLLARASARQRELAVRLSIGASRRQLLAQLCLESLQLALLGGAIGLLFAWWTTGIIAHNLPPVLTSSAELIRFRPRPALLLFAFAVSLVSAVLFGVLPALRATRGDLAASLKADARIGRISGRGKIDGGIVVAQVALALLLVSCAGLLVTTLRNLRAVDLGFRPEGLLLAEVEAPQLEQEQAALRPRIAEMTARLRALPGVQSAALAWGTPIVGGRFLRTNVRVAGYEPTTNEEVLTFSNGVEPDYFAAVGIPLLRGRAFTAADDSSAARVVVVNAAFVKRYFPARDPLGATIHLQYPFAALSRIAGVTSDEAVATIIGVAADSRYQDLRSPSDPLLYQSFAQIRGRPGRFVLTLRTDLDPATLGAQVRDIVNAASPGFRTWRISAMTEAIDSSLNRERLVAALAALFGALALALAAVGVYGIVAFAVTQRTKEIGIRIALGAESRSVLWLVGRTSLLIVGLGLLIGAPLAFAAARGIAAQLYGIGAYDPITMSGSALVLILAAVLATAMPALRATRVDPLTALQQE